MAKLQAVASFRLALGCKLTPQLHRRIYSRCAPSLFNDGSEEPLHSAVTSTTETSFLSNHFLPAESVTLVSERPKLRSVKATSDDSRKVLELDVGQTDAASLVAKLHAVKKTSAYSKSDRGQRGSFKTGAAGFVTRHPV
jgi:hypothetical protein